MSDAQLQRKLERLAALANELDGEAKRRFGDKGFLFYEASGFFHIMDGDSARFEERTSHVRARSRTPCTMGSGAW